MKRTFTSATLRLTGWYLLILACISLLFSVIVYQVSTSEIKRRLDHYHDNSWMTVKSAPQDTSFDRLRLEELDDSRASIIGVLVYMNIIVLGVGGGLSYLLARRTLRPIEEAHAVQARFVSDASHELRTPLAAMTTELEVALSDPSLKKSEMKTILSSNLEEVQRLTKLSSTLLALSSGDAKLIPQQPFTLSESLTTVVERFHQPKKRISIDLQSKDAVVVGNKSAVEDLLSILLDNAIKYSPSDSVIAITATPHDHRLHVQIANAGEGIAPEHLPHIFDRFYRADAARTGDNGYGLGLALAKQISDIHKANLSVKSTPNEQTVFSFSLQIINENKAKNQN